MLAPRISTILIWIISLASVLCMPLRSRRNRCRSRRRRGVRPALEIRGIRAASDALGLRGYVLSSIRCEAMNPQAIASTISAPREATTIPAHFTIRFVATPPCV
jgi:hypothetical protein